MEENIRELLRKGYGFDEKEIELFKGIEEKRYRERLPNSIIEKISDGLAKFGVPDEEGITIAEGYAWPLVLILKDNPDEAKRITKVGRIRIISSEDEENIPAYLRRDKGCEYYHTCLIPNMYSWLGGSVFYEVTIDVSDPEQQISRRVYKKE